MWNNPKDQRYKEETVRQYQVLAMAWAVAALFVFLSGCGGGISCDDYCDRAGDCAKMGDRMFSETDCKDTCKTDKERYESIDCGFEFTFFLECVNDLACNHWEDQGEKCGSEIDAINHCVEDHT